MSIVQQLTIDFFTRFLMLNGEVTIPGIGKFELNRSAARQDTSNDFISPPVYTVRFNSNKLEMSTLQTDYMIKKLKLSHNDIVAESDSFSESMKAILLRDKLFEWPGVGKLTYSDRGVVYFEGIRFDHHFLTNQPFVSNKEYGSSIEDSVSAESIDYPSSDDLEEVDSTKNRWKTASLFMLILVIATLLVRYLYGGFGIFEHRYDPIKTPTPSQTYQLK